MAGPKGTPATVWLILCSYAVWWIMECGLGWDYVAV